MPDMKFYGFSCPECPTINTTTPACSYVNVISAKEIKPSKLLWVFFFIFLPLLVVLVVVLVVLLLGIGVEPSCDCNNCHCNLPCEICDNCCKDLGCNNRRDKTGIEVV